jgi:hypothetical protein
MSMEAETRFFQSCEVYARACRRLAGFVVVNELRVGSDMLSRYHRPRHVVYACE